MTGQVSEEIAVSVVSTRGAAMKATAPATWAGVPRTPMRRSRASMPE